MKRKTEGTKKNIWIKTEKKNKVDFDCKEAQKSK